MPRPPTPWPLRRPRPPLARDRFSPAGIGGTPWNQELDYRGFVRPYTPNEFLRLAYPFVGEPHEDSVSYLLNAFRRGEPVANPFLQLEWSPEDAVWRTIGHEGRHRSLAFQRYLDRLEEESTMPVHLFPYGLRAHDLTPAMRDAPIVSETGLWKLDARRKGGLAEVARRRSSVIR